MLGGLSYCRKPWLDTLRACFQHGTVHYLISVGDNGNVFNGVAKFILFYSSGISTRLVFILSSTSLKKSSNSVIFLLHRISTQDGSHRKGSKKTTTTAATTTAATTTAATTKELNLHMCIQNSILYPRSQFLMKITNCSRNFE